MKISTASKKVLASALSAAMVVAFAPTVAFGATSAVTLKTTNDSGVATTIEFGTIAKALDKAKDGDTVVLNEDVVENVTVATGNKVTIDLAGHKLTTSGSADKAEVIIVSAGSASYKMTKVGTTSATSGYSGYWVVSPTQGGTTGADHVKADGVWYDKLGSGNTSGVDYYAMSTVDGSNTTLVLDDSSEAKTGAIVTANGDYKATESFNVDASQKLVLKGGNVNTYMNVSGDVEVDGAKVEVASTTADVTAITAAKTTVKSGTVAATATGSTFEATAISGAADIQGGKVTATSNNDSAFAVAGGANEVTVSKQAEIAATGDENTVAVASSKTTAGSTISAGAITATYNGITANTEATAVDFKTSSGAGTITGGKISGIVKTAAGKITGGTFTMYLKGNSMVDSGCTVVDNGTVSVVYKTAIASSSFSYTGVADNALGTGDTLNANKAVIEAAVNGAIARTYDPKSESKATLAYKNDYTAEKLAAIAADATEAAKLSVDVKVGTKIDASSATLKADQKALVDEFSAAAKKVDSKVIYVYTMSVELVYTATNGTKTVVATLDSLGTDNTGRVEKDATITLAPATTGADSLLTAAGNKVALTGENALKINAISDFATIVIDPTIIKDNLEDELNKPEVTEKATQGIDVSKKSMTVKLGAKKTKTAKAKTFSMGASAETELTTAWKSGSTKITVSGDKVKLAKGVKRGTYTAKVSLKAAASDAYLAAAKTITVKFVIK